VAKYPALGSVNTSFSLCSGVVVETKKDAQTQTAEPIDLGDENHTTEVVDLGDEDEATYQDSQAQVVKDIDQNDCVDEVIEKNCKDQVDEVMDQDDQLKVNDQDHIDIIDQGVEQKLSQQRIVQLQEKLAQEKLADQQLAQQIPAEEKLLQQKVTQNLGEEREKIIQSNKAEEIEVKLVEEKADQERITKAQQEDTSGTSTQHLYPDASASVLLATQQKSAMDDIR